MSLMKSKRMNLLHELVHLSNDEEIQPYIDVDTTARIKQILEQYRSLNFLEEYQDLESNFDKIRSKTAIDEADEPYQQNFPQLFEHDSTQALKEITIGLENNSKKINISNAISKMNINQKLFNNHQQNITSLASTCPKFNTLKFYDSNKQNTLGKKKSKQKLISYKIGKETPKFSKNIQSSHLTKTQSIQKTQKKSVSKVNSKGNLKTQNSKINPKSMMLSAKHQHHYTLKNSLLLTNKIKLNQKKSNMQETAKRQIKSFSSVETPIHSKSRQKNKKKQMLKKIKKMNTQFSTEEKPAKFPFLFEELQNNEQENISDQTIHKKHRMITEIPNQDNKSENQLISSIENFEQKNYLRDIISEIYSQQHQKLEQKQKLQQQISKIKEMIVAQNRKLQQVNNKSNKLIREIQTFSQFQKSINQERSTIQKSIYQTKRKVKALKQKYTQKKEEFKEIAEGGVKEEQQLIQMYEKVIDELRKEIREQNRLKNETKICLQKSQRKLQNKEIKFNSTLMSTKKIKDDLTDAFKQWV